LSALFFRVFQAPSVFLLQLAMQIIRVPRQPPRKRCHSTVVEAHHSDVINLNTQDINI